MEHPNHLVHPAISVEQIIDCQKSIVSNNTNSGSEKSVYASAVFINRGSIRYSFDNMAFTARETNAVLIAPGSKFTKNAVSDECELTCIRFTFHDSGEELLRTGMIRLNKSTECEFNFEKCCLFWKRNKPGYQLECKIALYHILLLIYQSGFNTLSDQFNWGKIEKSLNYLWANYIYDDLSISTLAEIADLSEMQFRRIFKEVYGVTPIKALTELRIKRARDLLVRTKMPIAEVAKESGFASAFYFSKIFKEATGKTPSQYRKKF